MAIHPVDPLESAPQLAELQRRVWRPPSLYYSVEYIRWQFGMPGRLQPQVVVIEHDGQFGGMTGITPRRVRIGTDVFDVFIRSFLALIPELRGQGNVERMYEVMIPLHKGTPMMMFTQDGSRAEALMRASFASTDWVYRRLGLCRTYGRFSGQPVADGLTVRTVTRYADWLALHDALAPAGMVQALPDEAQFEHYRQDPRGRWFTGVWDEAGQPLAAASTVMGEIATASGVVRSPTAELVALRAPAPAALGAALSYVDPAVMAGIAEDVRPSTVLAPNLSAIGEEIVRGAGLRAMPTAWVSHLFCPPDHPLAAASATNVEVV